MTIESGEITYVPSASAKRKQNLKELLQDSHDLGFSPLSESIALRLVQKRFPELTNGKTKDYAETLTRLYNSGVKIE